MTKLYFHSYAFLQEIEFRICMNLLRKYSGLALPTASNEFRF